MLVESGAVPQEFALEQCYPNPFNPTTAIGFDLPVASLVTLKVYDLLGREVVTLLEKREYEAGSFAVDFNAGTHASGVYIYKLTADGDGMKSQTFTNVKKMILMR